MHCQQRHHRPEHAKKSAAIGRQIRMNDEPERIQNVGGWAGVKNLSYVRKQGLETVEILKPRRWNSLPGPKNRRAGQRGDHRQHDASTLPVGNAALQQKRAGEGGAEKVQVEH